MPRIDPVQLLKCLSVLLDSNGGIKSQDEVQRLASLMTKFSKKLVSKCIYIHILKQTKTDLLGLFMGAGGWSLAHVWLTEGILAKNGALVKELLELLLVCPVDIDRLKSNNCPKLVKDLSKDGSIEDVRTLATKLVEQWLKIVKGEITVPLTLSQVNEILSPPEYADLAENIIQEEQSKVNCTYPSHSQIESVSVPESVAFEFISVDVNDDIKVDSNVDPNSKTNESIPILKISVKDGKKVVSKVNESVSDEIILTESDNNLIRDNTISDSKHKDERTKSKDKNRDKDRSSSSKSSSSNKSSSSKHSKSSSDSSDKSNSSHNKIKDIHHNKSSRSNSSKESKRSEKHKEKDADKRKELDKQKDKDRTIEKQKDKHTEKRKDKADNKSKDKETGKTDKHKTSEKQIKQKDIKIREQTEKNKETLQKLQPISLNKLGKIPKRPLEDTSKEKIEFKKEKPSISIEVRKPNDTSRPKTVKMFHSKFRSHGLEEEASKPPPRGLVKKSSSPLTPPVTLPTPKISSPPLKRSSPPPKRQSPPPLIDIPPEKKIKIGEHIDKPGAIKLIPPKPKRAAMSYYTHVLVFQNVF